MRRDVRALTARNHPPTQVRPTVVSAALQFSPSGGVLLSEPEELLATSVDGIATFDHLKIDKAATGCDFISKHF